MAKKVKKSNTIKGLLIALLVAVGFYLGGLLVIKQFAPAEGASKFYIGLYDHASSVLSFITDYGFVIVLLGLAVLALSAAALIKRK